MPPQQSHWTTRQMLECQSIIIIKAMKPSTASVQAPPAVPAPLIPESALPKSSAQALVVPGSSITGSTFSEIPAPALSAQLTTKATCTSSVEDSFKENSQERLFWEALLSVSYLSSPKEKARGQSRKRSFSSPVTSSTSPFSRSQSSSLSIHEKISSTSL